MMKKFLYFAFAAVAAMCVVACGDDSDDNKNDNGGNNSSQEVVLPPPAHANDAAEFELDNILLPQTSQQDQPQPSLKYIYVTEAGKLLLGLRDIDGTALFVQEDVNISGDQYTLAGGKGYIKKTTAKARQTRAGGKVSFDMNFTIDVPGYGPLTYTVTTDNPVSAIQVANSKTGGQLLTNLARTWKVVQMTLEIKGGVVSPYKEFPGGDLPAIAAEAKKHGCGLTDDEVACFNKSVKSFTISKEDLIAVAYTDGSVDAGSWSWASGKANEFMIKMKNSDMGNKFFNDGTKFDVTFTGTRCYLNLNTSVEESSSKKYDVALGMLLEQAN